MIVIGAPCLGAIIAGSLYALIATPAWYAPPVVLAADRQQVRNNLIDAEQAFTEGLRAGSGPFTYHIYQDDLNRWIALRREIYPLIDELVPHMLADPFVLFDDGEITLAGRYTASAVDLLLSIDIVPTFEAETITLRAKTVRCGSVGMPKDFGQLGLDDRIERDREQTWPGSPRMWGDFLTGLHLEARAWWKNGGIEYRVLDVQVQPGVLSLKIEPLGPHWALSNQD